MLGATPAAATSTVMRMIAAPASTGPGRRTGSTVLVARSRAIATSPEIARSSAMELQAFSRIAVRDDCRLAPGWRMDRRPDWTEQATLTKRDNQKR